ncbi:MAG: DUF4197 family protein [Pseudomonadota bacterium]
MTIATSAVTTRRTFITSAAAAMTLAGCATTGNGLGGLPNLAQVLKDLLGLSAERAFVQLLQPDGFLNDELARLDLPGELQGTGGFIASILQTPAFRDALLKQVNAAATVAAEVAEPIVDDAIRSLTFADAQAVLSGGPQAATSILEARIGDGLGDRIVPAALRGLGIGNTEIVTRAISAVAGFDIDALAGNVGRQASSSIFRAIGREEAAIRADPASTNNPALIAALLALG